MKYVAQNFKDGEVLRADQLNYMEAGITQLFESDKELSEKIPALLDKDIAIEANLKSLSEADKSMASQINELSEADKSMASQINELSEVDKNTASQIEKLSTEIPKTYVKKITPHNTGDQVHVTRNLTYGNGEETTYFLSKSSKKTSNSTIPLRKEDGNIAVPLTPSDDGDAASKYYVDKHAGGGGGKLYLHMLAVDASQPEYQDEYTTEYSTAVGLTFMAYSASSEPIDFNQLTWDMLDVDGGFLSFPITNYRSFYDGIAKVSGIPRSIGFDLDTIFITYVHNNQKSSVEFAYQRNGEYTIEDVCVEVRND